MESFWLLLTNIMLHLSLPRIHSLPRPLNESTTFPIPSPIIVFFLLFYYLLICSGEQCPVRMEYTTKQKRSQKEIFSDAYKELTAFNTDITIYLINDMYQLLTQCQMVLDRVLIRRSGECLQR